MIHTLPQTKSFRRQRRSFSTSAQDFARYLVAEYLYDWGLRDPEIIADESRRIVEQAEAATLAVPPDLFERELCEEAIRLTVAEVEAAIAKMGVNTPAPRHSRAPTNNSVLPHIANVLLEFPDAIRHRDRPPAQLLAVLETSIAPIVPLPKKREMLPQPRTRLWKVLRRGYWRMVARRLQDSWSAVCKRLALQ